MAILKCDDGTIVQISAKKEQELRVIYGESRPKFGDIVTCKRGRRIVLRDTGLCSTDGGLWAYDKSGSLVGDASYNFYTPTGENIFIGNLLRLDS